MSLSAAFASLAMAFFLLRIDYSRIQFLSSFFLSLACYTYIQQRVLSNVRLRLGVIPSARTQVMPYFATVDWVMLNSAESAVKPDVDAVVTDLRGEHSAGWEQQITRYVMNGTPVYHHKQVLEQLSGRVEIDHLSENTLGSLNPNGVYLRAKALGDALIAAILLFVLAPVLLVVSILVRIESPGPAIFRQQRIGFRGRVFTVYKIRTMRLQIESDRSDQQIRHAAMTKPDDPRVTRLGTFLRRSRIDELPQLYNIVRGEMSLIGPRPEVVALSRWYESENSILSLPSSHQARRQWLGPGQSGPCYRGRGSQGKASSGLLLRQEFFFLARCFNRSSHTQDIVQRQWSTLTRTIVSAIALSWLREHTHLMFAGLETILAS